MPSLERLKADAAEHEAEANLWAGREADLAGQVQSYLNKRDEASADVFETRRQEAAEQWLKFCRLAEDARREVWMQQAEDRRRRDLFFVGRAA